MTALIRRPLAPTACLVGRGNRGFSRNREEHGGCQHCGRCLSGQYDFGFCFCLVDHARGLGCLVDHTWGLGLLRFRRGHDHILRRRGIGLGLLVLHNACFGLRCNQGSVYSVGGAMKRNGATNQFWCFGGFLSSRSFDRARCGRCFFWNGFERRCVGQMGPDAFVGAHCHGEGFFDRVEFQFIHEFGLQQQRPHHGTVFDTQNQPILTSRVAKDLHGMLKSRGLFL